jgi:hypothetical protein
LALLDSGADISLSSGSLAKTLGLDTEIGRIGHVQGIAGEPVTAYFYPVTLQVPGGLESINVEVAFSDSLFGTALLGQADFFEHYQIKFERFKERIEIKPAVDLSTRPSHARE